MATPAERRALLFLTAVCALGAGVRVARAVGRREPVPAAAERALVAQQVAIDRAGARRDSAREARATRRAVPAGRGSARRTPGAPRTPPVPPPRPGPVDVDVATAAELEALPRIGPSLAARIVADRDSLGPFGSLAGLDRVRGVGPALLRGLGAHVTFSGTPRPSGDPPQAPQRARRRRPAAGAAPRASAAAARPLPRSARLTPSVSRAPPPWPFRQPPPPSASATC
jgi:competence protein ComEA